MITEATRTNLSAEGFENIYAHVTHMVDSNDYVDRPGVVVDRYIMSRAVRLADGSASIGGSPRESIPVVSATVELDQGDYQARTYKYAGQVYGQVEIVRGEGEYKATIHSPRATILVASLAAKAIDRSVA